MFHVSPSLNRDSIQATGLNKRQGHTPRVYLAPEHDIPLRDNPHSDVWKVDVTGVPLRPDHNDGGDAVYAQRSFPPARVALHKTGDPGEYFR